MANTTGRLNLPYILQSQSQKEVSYNNALNILDILIQAVMVDIGVNTPPSSPTAGACYIVGTSPTGAWVGYANYIAQAQAGGGWVFVAPFNMLECWVTSQQNYYVYNGTTSAWMPQALILKSTGESLTLSDINQDVTVSGSSTTSTIQIPNRALVIAVNVHVITAITGASSFSIGVSGDTGRYGNSIGAALDSTNVGVTYNPIAYYANTSLLFTPAGGNFTGGVIRTNVQYLLPHGPWTWP